MDTDSIRHNCIQICQILWQLLVFHRNLSGCCTSLTMCMSYYHSDNITVTIDLLILKNFTGWCHNCTSLMELTLSHDVSSACCNKVFCCDNLNNARHLLSFLSMDSQNLCMMGNLRLNDSCI